MLKFNACHQTFNKEAEGHTSGPTRHAQGSI